MEEKIFFKLKINIPELDKYLVDTNKCAFIYDAELTIEQNINPAIWLKVFYDSKEYLAHKIMRWKHLQNKNIVSKLEVLEIYEPQNLIEIDFSEISDKGLSTSTSYYEHGTAYFIIKLDGIKKIYLTEKAANNTSEVYLNKAGFNVVELNYKYYFPLPWQDEEYKWEPINANKKFIPFNEISFRPEHHFYVTNKNEEELISIRKEPKLSIKHNEGKEREIKMHVKLLCALYSFYMQEKVDYSLLRIYTGNRLYIECKEVDSVPPSHEHGLFRWEFNSNPSILLRNISVPYLLENLEFTVGLIDRFNFSFQIYGEAKFMILYNVLEQLRNHYILKSFIETEKAGHPPKLKRVVEEYRFVTKSKKEINDYIRSLVQKIVEIVHDDDKEMFNEEIMNKVNLIKLSSMKNQFKSLFRHLSIDLNAYDLNFEKLLSLRNSIFHGRPIKENNEYLKEINNYNRLPKFTGEVIIKYLGIKNLSTLKHIQE